MATRDIAELGIVVDARQAQAATRALDDLDQQGKRTAGSMKFLENAAKLLAAAFAAVKLAKLIEESTMLAARFETMGVVMRVAGNNAGYTGAQMQGLEKDLTKTGISMIKARENLTGLATANIDLSKASKLARAAQDLAVVGNINSSEAFSRLTNGIKTGEVEVLRTLGLNVSFEGSYKRLAAQLGTTSDKLTEQQKIQARTNEVLKQSAAYAGIYEEAMGTAGKQVNSLSRYVEDAKVKLGNFFLAAFSDAVVMYTDALKDANKELDKLGSNGTTGDVGATLSDGFRVAAQTILVLGANVGFVLKTMGREIGGFGAILAEIFVAPLRAVNNLGGALDAALSGDFKGAGARAAAALQDLKNGVSNVGATLDDLDEKAEADARALDKFTESVMSGAKATVAASKEEQDAKEATRMAAGKAAREAQAAADKALAAAEEARKQQKKYDEAYKGIIKSIEEKTAASALDLATEGKLTEGQKFAVKILEDLRTGEIKLSASKKIKLAAMLNEMLAQEAFNAEHDKYVKGQEDALKQDNATIKSIYDEVSALEEQIKYYGLSADEITNRRVLKLEADLANAQGNEAVTATIQAQIDALDILASKQRELAGKDSDKKRLEDLRDLAKKTSDGIRDNITDALLRGFEAGKSAAQAFRDSVVNMFKTLVLRPIVQGIVQPVANGVTSLLGIGQAGASGSGGTASTLNTLSAIKSAYSAITAGFAGISTAVADGVQAAMYGTGMTTQIASNGAFATGAGAAAGIGAGVLGGVYGGRAISGQYGSNSTVNAGTAIGAVVGSIVPVIGTALGALVGGLLGGVANRLFGMGNKNVTASGVRGTLGASGFSGEMFQNWHQDGGLFRSDKNGTDTQAASSETVKAFSDAYQGIKDASAGFAQALGVNTESIKSRTQDLNIAITGNAETDAKAVTDFFTGVADAIASELVPGLAAFKVEGESASATLQRLASEYSALDGIFSSMGLTVQQVLGATGTAALAAQEQLLKAAGGLDKLASATSYFNQNFLSASEQLAPVQAELHKQLTALGYGSVQTALDFKGAVQDLAASGALATAEGAKTYAALLALAPAMKAVTDAADAAKQASDAQAAADAKTAADAAQVAADAAAKQAEIDAAAAAKTADLNGQIYDLTHTSQEAVLRQRQLELSALSATDAALQQRIYDLQDEAAAQAIAADAIKAAQESAAAATAAAQTAQKNFYSSIGDSLVAGMNAAAQAAKDLQSSLTALMTGSLSPLSDQAKYDAAKAAFAGADASNPSAYNSASQAFLQASQSLNGSSSFGYARDFAAVTNGMQSGIDAANYTASGVGQRAFWESLQNMNMQSSSVATPAAAVSSVVSEAIDNMNEKVTRVLMGIQRSTSDTAQLTDRVTQGGNATRTESVS